MQVARLYYYQGMTTEAVAREMGISRPAVSRLLTFARQSGLVEIRVHDPENQPQHLEREICDRYKLRAVRVVKVPLNSREDEWLTRVAAFTANHLNGLIHSDMTVGVAWGNTLDAVSRRLTPKHCARVNIVQLNGSGSSQAASNYYTSDIYIRFAENYGARTHLFPVPTFFDYPETKQAMWKERSIQRLVKLASEADLLVYSIGAASGRQPSYVYVGGYLEEEDFREAEPSAGRGRHRHGVLPGGRQLPGYFAQRAGERPGPGSLPAGEARAVHRLWIGQGQRPCAPPCVAA